MTEGSAIIANETIYLGLLRPDFFLEKDGIMLASFITWILDYQSALLIKPDRTYGCRPLSNSMAYCPPLSVIDINIKQDLW